jgi:hypothetical protein
VLDDLSPGEWRCYCVVSAQCNLQLDLYRNIVIIYFSLIFLYIMLPILLKKKGYLSRNSIQSKSNVQLIKPPLRSTSRLFSSSTLSEFSRKVKEGPSLKDFIQEKESPASEIITAQNVIPYLKDPFGNGRKVCILILPSIFDGDPCLQLEMWKLMAVK